MKTDPIIEAVRNIKFNHVEPIKEKVDWNSLNKLNLENALFAGTDIPDLANYPKKPKTQF